ncbi:DNA-binding SARP family transcriptional activator [Nocardiopsis mwathae]|uniref:DNA-binding SARP family transcriptional activator n=1 Tax=Nocardiopsis mwathae TaxID=1472723 RepID=A0A7W9YM57_9ACTN|nr:BTAD domain-containing putative transcriptional regulator [Nocardiopsis mwathae]MBB6174539.1 DNA-binding SARP family transcriptional activator [Nocardiopsis mwathae]
MYFRMLGPLEVSLDGRGPVPLGRTQRRIVLAKLLAEVNRTVPVGLLVEAVWGGCPPRSAEQQIQTAVWRLRRAFAAAGCGAGDGGDTAAARIETTASGYALHAVEEQVDASVFRRLTREARAHAADDPRQAIARYREALALFRGPALGDVPAAFAESVAARWEERRVAALEECVELELRCGRGHGLIDELGDLVRRYPLRERLRGHLMSALYGADRRAEALAAYQEGRRAVVAELGLEPSPHLSELHRRILRGEPAAGGAAPSTGRAPGEEPAIPPAWLPSDIPDFVGRSEQVERISRTLAGEAGPSGRLRVESLTGPPGAGVSTLVVHAAHLVRADFPDGQLYADFAAPGTETADDVLRCFLRGLGVSEPAVPTAPRQRVGLYRTLLSDRRVLVVLDNVVSAGQVRPLLPGGPSSAVLVAARAPLTEIPGCRTVEVDALSTDEAVELLTSIAGLERVLRAPAAVHGIVQAAGHLPMTVRAAGAHLAARADTDLSAFLRRLSDPGRRLDALTLGTLDLREGLARRLVGLPQEAVDLWYALGLLGTGEVSLQAAALTGGVTPARAEGLLGLLVDRRVLDPAPAPPGAPPRYRLRELFGLYARERGLLTLPEPVRRRALPGAGDRRAMRVTTAG